MRQIVIQKAFKFYSELIDLRASICRGKVNNIVRKSTNLTIQGGPFVGMKMTDNFFGDKNLTPKLLGVYEQEIQEYFVDANRNNFDVIIDVGCGIGYYAVGLAMIFPKTFVYAFDIDKKVLNIAKENSHINGVSDRINFGVKCSPDHVISIAAEKKRMLLVCDCEGYEIELLSNSAVVNALFYSDLVIECHDFIKPNCTSILQENFQDTHEIKIIYAAGRNPNIFPFLFELDDLSRWKSISENRACRMNWIICRSKNISNA